MESGTALRMDAELPPTRHPMGISSSKTSSAWFAWAASNSCSDACFAQKDAGLDWQHVINEINSAHMIGRFTVCSVILAGMAWACETQCAFASQEPPHCSVVGDLDVRPFTSRVFHNTRMLRVWLPPGYKNPDQRSKRYPVMYLNDGQDLFDACTSIFNAQEWRVDETRNSADPERKNSGAHHRWN